MRNFIGRVVHQITPSRFDSPYLSAMPTPLSTDRLRTLVALAVALLVSGLSLLTMLPGVGYIDSGEMAAAAATLGIPHPTGYPLLMMLGKLWTIPFGDDPVAGLNLMNALLTGSSVGLLVLLFSRFLATLTISDVERRGDRTGRVWIPASAALLVGTGTIWWSVGTGFEAYGLHAFLLALLCWSFLRFTDAIAAESLSRSDDHGRKRTRRTGFFFALVLGLAFSNHLTTVILAPAFLTHYALVSGINRRTFTRLLTIAPATIIGLLPYLYLPIRAASSPPLNWGIPDTFDRFLRHVAGSQYQGLMFDWSVTGDQLGWFFSTLASDFFWVGVILFIPGLVYLYQRGRRRLLFALIILLSTLLFSGTYAIREIEPYFLTAMLALGFLLSATFAWAEGRARPVLLLSLLALLPLQSIVVHYGEVDRSEETLPQTFAHDLLDGLPENALLITGKWDYLISTTIYAQFGEGYRPDVTIMHAGMMHDTIYIAQLLGRRPDLGNASSQIRAFIRTRRAYGRGEIADPELYRRAYVAMINGMITVNEGGPVYVTTDVDPLIGKGLHRVPHNLAIALRRGEEYLPAEPHHRTIPIGTGPDLVNRIGVALHYGEMASLRAAYEEEEGRPERAAEFRATIERVAPTFEIEDVPVMPLGNRAYVERVLRWFEREAIQ